MTLFDTVGFLIAGAFGALARDCIQDNKIQLPYRENRSLVLGFIGGMLIGAFVGLAVDHSFLTSMLAGYTGVSAIRHLLPREKDSKPEVKE